MASDSDEMDVSKNDSENDDFDEETSSDSEDDADDDDEIDEDQQEAELMKLREIVNSNLYNYQSHLEYIGLAKKYCNLDHLRYSRQAMSEVFPLTEELWLDWLRDEQKLLTLAVGHKRDLSDLFERAINDYLSVMIWIEYIQYRISIDLTSNDLDNLRNLCERALSHCACHLTSGHLVWSVYMEIEKAKLDGLVRIHEQNPTDDSNEKLSQQIDYLLKLYRRQLSIPLREMKTVHDEYEEFCQQYKIYLPNDIEQSAVTLKHDFDKAFEHLEKCEKFERELEDMNNNLNVYKEYIRFEKETTRIQCLYERAIVHHCLDGDLWLSYVDFLEEALPSSTLLRKIFERSLRNVPWIAKLWIRYAEFMEHEHLSDHSQMKTIFDRGLNSDPSNLVSFVQLQLSYLQYCRRHYEQQRSQAATEEQLNGLKEEIRRACENACDQYQELFLSSADPKLFLSHNGQIEMFWIHLEVKSFHSIEHARNIWNGRTLLSKSHNQMISNLWKQFYYMEISDGDLKHARRVLYRALNHVQTMDYPNIICDLLIDHEKKYGSIEQLKETQEKLREVRKTLPIPDKSQKRKPEKPADTKKSQNDKTKTKQIKQAKQEAETTKLGSARKRKLTSEETESVKKKPVESVVDSDGFKVPLPPSSIIPKPPVQISSSDEVNHLTTIFISNLPYGVQDESIRELFTTAGPIKQIRLVKHEWSGKSKGFGYVDFTTVEGYQAALKLDRQPLSGRPVYVSAYDPNRSTSEDIAKKFKYATSLEQNKLFVSNLPFSLTKEELEKIFIDHGFKPKDVRLVTHRSGKPKGLAYLEFNDANEASQAVIKVDNYEVSGHHIKVAISNPPKRATEPPKPVDTTENGSAKRPTSLGEAPKSTGARGKGYSQLAFVPRKVSNTAKTPSNETNNSTSNKMSNSDFRQMLLNKK